MGLRVGELVALKWDDILDKLKLHVVLIPKAMDIFNRINREGEYIFMREGERITSRQVAYVLEKYAQRNVRS